MNGANASERLDRLEAVVHALQEQVASLQQSRMASQAFGPFDPIPKIGPGAEGWDLPEVRPVELDPKLVKDLREAVVKLCKGRKEADGEQHEAE